MTDIYFIRELPQGRVKVWSVCPVCRLVEIEIKNEFEVARDTFDEIKKDGHGNNVYIRETLCRDCREVV